MVLNILPKYNKKFKILRTRFYVFCSKSAAMFFILLGDPGPPSFPTGPELFFLPEFCLFSSQLGGMSETNLVLSSAWLARWAAAVLKRAARSRTLTSSSTRPVGQLERDVSFERGAVTPLPPEPEEGKICFVTSWS